MIKTVLIIGFGTLGTIHADKISNLPDFRVAGIVDPKPQARSRARVKADIMDFKIFANLHEAYQKNDFDVVVVTSNTINHIANIQLALSLSHKTPALFVEKPLGDEASAASVLEQQLNEKGYGKHIAFSCAYLIRESAIVPEAIDYLASEHDEIKQIDITWQKKRKNSRASAGVIQDESTHGLDLAHYLLDQNTELRHTPSSVKISHAVRSSSVVDIEEQHELYPSGHPNRVPFSEVSYRMTYPDGVVINGDFSFNKAPQLRQLVLITQQGRRLVMRFDDNHQDVLEVYDASAKRIHLSRTSKDKIEASWRNFAHYVRSGQSSQQNAGLKDALRDVKLTNVIERAATRYLEAHELDQNSKLSSAVDRCPIKPM